MSGRISKLLPAVLLLATAAFGGSTGEFVADARAALDRGDLDAAIAQLEKAVASDPNSLAAHSELGEAYGRKAEKNGLFGGISFAKKAKSEFERCVEIDPDSFDARLRLIEFYVRAPGIAGGSAKKARDQAAQIGKRSARDGHRALAFIYTLERKYDLAEKERQEARASQ